MLIVALGPGAVEAVPHSALAVLAGCDRVRAVACDEAVTALLHDVGVALADEAPVLAAPDAEAHRLAATHPAARTMPEREALALRAIGAEVAELVAVGAHLRRECPWDREQTAATIVPHTIEEAFEVADAVAADGDGLPDELGDLLFQAVFLSQLLSEEGIADLAAVARGQRTKLISRHPHVYGEEVAESAAGVVDVWERRKREERADQGIFHDLPAGLPALAFATKAQKRAAAVGFHFADVPAAVAALIEEVAELQAEPSAPELGDVLFAAVAVARSLGADPELALRATARRFRARVEEAQRLAAAAGEDFEHMAPERQLQWYDEAHEREGQ